jgi:hypothetical protein
MMRVVGLAIRMGEKKMHAGFWWGNPARKRSLALVRHRWYTIRRGDGLLSMPQRNFRFNNID